MEIPPFILEEIEIASSTVASEVRGSYLNSDQGFAVEKIADVKIKGPANDEDVDTGAERVRVRTRMSVIPSFGG